MAAGRFQPAQGLVGRVTVPGDKSISHRAALLSALGSGRSTIEGLNPGADVGSTLDVLSSLGVEVTPSDSLWAVEGSGWNGILEPERPLNAGNSGTTLRLMLGVLAGGSGCAVLDGDSSLRRRPMLRVVTPLRAMGAHIDGRRGGDRAPLTVVGRPLRGRSHTLEVASAQVKSALLLAGLKARGRTAVTEPALSRDHTERMLQWLGVPVRRSGTSVEVEAAELPAARWKVPGDMSSAAALLVAGVLVEASAVTVADIGCNPARCSWLEVLRAMGAEVAVDRARDVCGEPVADVTARSSALRARVIGGPAVPGLIDELPLLAVAATQAEGTTVVRDASELRVKESDRISAMETNLRSLGAEVRSTRDGWVIHGPTRLRGGRVESFGDHRIALALAVAGLVAEDEVTVGGAECVDVSWPGFATTLYRLTGRDGRGSRGAPSQPSGSPAPPDAPEHLASPAPGSG